MIEDEAGPILERVDVPVSYIHGEEGQELLPELAVALEGRRGRRPR